MEAEDKAKVVNALGGKSGLLDSTLPSIFFLIAYNITHRSEEHTSELQSH